MHGKGEFAKMKGTICNIPVDSDEVSKNLPRGADSNGITIVKLKRQLKYKGHYICEPVRPDIMCETLNYLKANNHLYSDIKINTDQIDAQLLDLEIINNSDEEPGDEVMFNEILNPILPTTRLT